MDGPELARRYYRALDAGEYDALRDLLAPGFTHVRPDRTIEGREAFVAFMRDERPETDTSHEVETVFEGAPGVAVRGRVLRADGSAWFAFVDAFAVADGALASLTTYTA
jgi:ketosteroid isomerase-like protein